MGTVKGRKYLDEVIKPIVILLMGQLGDEFISVHDNAPCHRTIIVRRELDVNKVMRLPWLARSIEHAWDMLERVIPHMPDQPQILFALENAIRVR
jgi:hypothetical protein